MKVSVSLRTLCVFLRLGLLALAFICLFYAPASAQTCGANCTVVYAGDDADDLCYTRDHTTCPGGNFSLTISFGQTVDFFQPVGVASFDAHTATSGTCGVNPPHTCTPDGNFRAPGSGNMVNGTDYPVAFNGGALGIGSHPFFCTPHGFSMTTGTITVIADATSTSVVRSSGPNPSIVGQSVQFKATVSNTIIPGTIPTGGVTFEDFGVPISSNLPLDGAGSATFTTTSLASGTRSITAVYTPDVTTFSGSNSNASPLSQLVEDFSITISNPAGAASPGGNYDYTGTLSAIDSYPNSVNITCQGSTPGTCALLTPANPVPMGSGFTVRASNPSAAPIFSFNIQGIGTSTPTVTHAFPVTLNVGSFNLGTPNPSTVTAVQGNPSNTTAFQVSALGGFSGEVDMSCPAPPPGVTCIFSNGSATQALFLGVGQTINDTLTLNTSSSLAAGPYTVTMQAAPLSGTSQTQDVSLTESSATQANTFIYFGDTPDGQTQHNVNPPHTLLLDSPLNFNVSAYNEDVANANGVTLVLVFTEPFKSASATPGGTCTNTSSVEITCDLGIITPSAPWIKTVSFSIVPFPGRSLDFAAILSESNKNATAKPTHLSWTTFYRYRPMLRPGQKPGNTNPK